MAVPRTESITGTGAHRNLRLDSPVFLLAPYVKSEQGAIPRDLSIRHYSLQFSPLRHAAVLVSGVAAKRDLNARVSVTANSIAEPAQRFKLPPKPAFTPACVT